MNAAPVNPTTVIVLVTAAYLLGAVPFGLLIGLARGIDVRKGGSGNIGSTNVTRLLGRKWGYVCFLLDTAKGLGPTLAAGAYLRHAAGTTLAEPLPLAGLWTWLAVAAACVLGHIFSIYLRFRGGKGVATSLGVLLGIYPYFTLAALFALLIWLAVWGFWRYVSLASISAAIAFPIGFALLIWRIPAWQFGDLWPLLLFSGLMAVLVVVRHRSNLARLLRGVEHGGNRPSSAAEPAGPPAGRQS